jgi:NAD(P)-dependent dehydrogenase (short-subunit alcohol dehydrogenase family)
VTGAARTGAAIAERLAADGATVAINYSKSAKQAESVEEVICVGVKAKALLADVSDRARAKVLADAASTLNPSAGGSYEGTD